MSSSERNYIRRPEFVDLHRGDPPPREPSFSDQIDFERLENSVARELTPDEAYRNGLAEGQQLGRDATMKELSPVLDEFRAIAKSMAIVREQRMSDAERELVDVATEVAQRILRAELAQGDDAAVQLARACIAEAAGERPLTLHVAPSDLERMRAYIAEIELDLADEGIQLQANPAVEPGGVLLETPTRVYDGRPERILGAAKQCVEAAKGRS